MLQRIHDSAGRWMAAILLGLVSVGFVFWGVDFGLNSSATFAAKVNGENVPLTEFDRELQARQSQYQQLYRTELTEDMRRQLRRAVIENLVQETALKQRVDDQGYRVSDRRLEEAIRSIAAFQVDGQYSEEVAVGLLMNQGISPQQFKTLQRESMQINELQSGIVDSTFLTPAEFRRYIQLYNQKREIAYAIFEAESFAPQVMVEDDAIAERYENNQASYQTAETVDLEYIELALADIADKIEVTDDELRAAYDEEKQRFETQEERRADHILIEIGDDEDAARTKAQEIADRARGGEDFAKLAREFSADAGTKDQGGELGWVSRGMLEGPFEDALFAMQPGEISDPVRTEFGFHVIRLDEVRAGEVQSFEEVKDTLAEDLKTRRAEDDFYTRANELENHAFDAYNDLTPVSDTMKLPVKTLMGFPRTGDPDIFGENSPAVVQAAFSEEIVDSGRNSRLVELGDDHVLVLRVTAHHLPMTKPLDEVREQIRADLVRERSQALAEEAAKAFLADVEKGADPAAAAMERGGTWTAAAWVERTDPNVPTEVLSGVFAMPKATPDAPRRETIALANGNQAVVVLSNVVAGEPSSMAQAERDQRQKQLAEQSARAELTAYVGSVRNEASVKIPPDILEPPAY
jgi:peptidyl-prolyl cis-trans isomerase D